jgi:hypothetical protein
MNYSKLFLGLSLLAAAPAPSAIAAYNSITPGSVWNDTSGTHINAHGGGVVFLDGTYYWFGEDRTGSKSNGISCYTSTDLYNWKRVGLVLKASQAYDPETNNCILERPKVVYNDTTGKWVMHLHWEDGTGYGKARIGVATCDKIDGSYTFIGSYRPNDHDSRDQTVFKDTDGKAYHFGSTDMNTNMLVCLMTDDYLATATPVTETKILKGLQYEAPAIFKVGDVYYGLFSGCTGWDPNPGHSASTTEILGDWTTGKNFAIDSGSATTYKSQSTFVLKVDGYESAYIYMGDRWNSSDVGGKSEYVWLPLSIRSGAPTVKWYDSWTTDLFANSDRFKRAAKLEDGMDVLILDKYSDRWMSTSGNGFYIDDDNDDTNITFTLEATINPYVWRLKNAATGQYFESIYGALHFADYADTPMQEWRFEVEEDGCYKIQNSNDGKLLTVSGASTYAKSPLFMIAEGASTAQSFGVYFDSKAHRYTAADMFSADYRAANVEALNEQLAFEDSQLGGISNAISDGARKLELSVINHILKVNSPCDLGNSTIDLFDVGSGRNVASLATPITAGENTISIPANINNGIYAMRLTIDNEIEVMKITIR